MVANKLWTKIWIAIFYTRTAHQHAELPQGCNMFTIADKIAIRLHIIRQPYGDFFGDVPFGTKTQMVDL